MLQVKLNGLKFHSHIGLYHEEQFVGQDMTISTTLQLKVADPILMLNDTVNYGEIYTIIKKAVCECHAKLIETLAISIAHQIKERYSRKVSSVTVSIKKEALPIDGLIKDAEWVNGAS